MTVSSNSSYLTPNYPKCVEKFTRDSSQQLPGETMNILSIFDITMLLCKFAYLISLISYIDCVYFMSRGATSSPIFYRVLYRICTYKLTCLTYLFYLRLHTLDYFIILSSLFVLLANSLTSLFSLFQTLFANKHHNKNCFLETSSQLIALCSVHYISSSIPLGNDGPFSPRHFFVGDSSSYDVRMVLIPAPLLSTTLSIPLIYFAWIERFLVVSSSSGPGLLAIVDDANLGVTTLYVTASGFPQFGLVPRLVTNELLW